MLETLKSVEKTPHFLFQSGKEVEKLPGDLSIKDESAQNVQVVPVQLT